MENSSTDNVVKFRKALREVFKSESGQTVLNFLQEAYVDVPVVDERPEITYYRLGQKEFVQGFIKDATQDISELENLVKGG